MKNSTRLVMLLILLGTLFLYGPSINWGFIWDDPVWYGHVMGKTWWETLLPTPSFQYYRPFTMLYNRLFLLPDNTFAVELMHWSQIGWHLLNVTLVYALGRRLGLGRWASVSAMLFFAFYPLTFQAVAWAAPQQPMVSVLQNLSWLTYFSARRASQPHPKRMRAIILMALSLSLFVTSLAVQELGVTLAVLPLLFEFVIRLKIRRWRDFVVALRRPRLWSAALLYPLTAVIYSGVWWLMPRQAGIVQLALEPDVGRYLWQSVIYPLLGRPGGYGADNMVDSTVFIGMSVAVTLALVAVATMRRRGRVAWIGLIWACLSFLPTYAGLKPVYVLLASRLVYVPAIGVVLLWGAALGPVRRPRFRLFDVVGSILVLFIAGQSLWLLFNFRQLYQQGVAHLAEAVAVFDEGDERLLFVNFPDRYAWKQPPYPYGYWGLTLAPVVVDLDDFPPIINGRAAASLSRSMPWIDQDARLNGPYQVDMRGVIIQPQELYMLAAEQDALYLSRYLPDGRFQMQMGGWLQSGLAQACPLARFGADVCLHSVHILETETTYEVQSSWSTQATLPPQMTIFVHLGQPGQPPLAQADGDTWREMLPLSTWQPGDLIHDVRSLPRLSLDEAPENSLEIRIGVYNRLDGRRLPGTLIEGQEERPLPDDALRIKP